jgi:hypothetical protein
VNFFAFSKLDLEPFGGGEKRHNGKKKDPFYICDTITKP